MDDNVIELAARRPARTATPVQAAPSAEVLDVLLGILNAAKASGTISHADRLRFAVYTQTGCASLSMRWVWCLRDNKLRSLG